MVVTQSFEAPLDSFFRRLSCRWVVYFRCCCYYCCLAGGVLRRNCFLCTQCPKISVLLFGDGLYMRMENFSCRHSLHTFSLSADDFTLLTISHLMLKSVLFFFSLQIRSLRVVVVHLCSSLNDDLRRLNLVLNSFSVSPMCLSCFLESVSVTVGL